MKRCTMFTRKLKCALEKDFAYARTKKTDIFQRFLIILAFSTLKKRWATRSPLKG